MRVVEKVFYMELIGEVESFVGAREVIEDFKGLGYMVVLVFFVKFDEFEYYLMLLDVRLLVDVWIDFGDVEKTKFELDFLFVAFEKVDV